MDRPAIEKSDALIRNCNMPDYPEAVQQFSWENARQMLDGLLDGILNIACEALDRHVEHGRSDVIALRGIAKDLHRKDFTYADLTQLSNRFSKGKRFKIPIPEADYPRLSSVNALCSYFDEPIS